MKTPPSKKCPRCSSSVHARKSECSCGHIFYHKKNRPVDNWKELKVGEAVKSVHGNGPYWQDPETKEKIYMGHYGKFIVKDVGKDYLKCSPVRTLKSASCGTYILYMGRKTKSLLCDNFYRRPHKLVRVSLSRRKGESK